MKHHLFGLTAAILTFIIGWSIQTILLKLVSESVVLPSVATRSEVPAVWAILLANQNRDLREIDGPQKAQLQSAIETLRGVTENENLFQSPFLRPRLFSQVSSYMGEQRYVLIEEAPLVMIPGDSRLQVSLFDLDGKLLASSDFGAGWRIALRGIQFIQVKDIAKDILEVESSAFINGADVAKQYYALVGDKMRLIRLEDSTGRLRHNIYGSPNHTIGFTEVGRSAEDWQRALITKDETEVLATLTWLGGSHLNIERGVPEYTHEDLSEARLVEEVRARPAVKKAVNAMKDHPHKWIREAARLAAEQLQN